MTPEYEPTLRVPDTVETGAADTIWTPTNVKFVQSWLVGHVTETHIPVWKLEFLLNFKGEKKTFSVLYEEGDKFSQYEDLLGKTAERTAEQIAERLEQRGSKLRPEDLSLRENVDVRRQLAGAFRDFRSWRKKQKESTVGKTLFPGTN